MPFLRKYNRFRVVVDGLQCQQGMDAVSGKHLQKFPGSLIHRLLHSEQPGGLCCLCPVDDLFIDVVGTAQRCRFGSAKVLLYILYERFQPPGIQTVESALQRVFRVGGCMLGGFAGGMICYGGILLKNRLGYDDALDVVGIHGVGGTWGAFATGLFASAGINGVNGLFYGNPWQLVVQVISIVATWSFVYLVSRILLKLTDSLVGLRVDPASEIRGLDLSLHNERGYTL